MGTAAFPVRVAPDVGVSARLVRPISVSSPSIVCLVRCASVAAAVLSVPPRSIHSWSVAACVTLPTGGSELPLAVSLC